MAELIVTTQLDTSGFDSGVAKVKSAIAELSGQPVVIKVKLEGGYEKLTKDLAKVAIEQAKATQATARQAIAEANLAAQKERSAQADERMLGHRARIISSENSLLALKERTEQADERSLASKAKIVQAEERTKQSIEKTNQASIRANAQMAAGAKDATAATNQFANSVNRVSEAFSGWVTRNIWMTLRNGLRDALNTMREMDTQLTTIRRVSGMSEAEAGKYQEQAYDISSRYGVKPADYLSNVVAFTRAGYGSMAGELAEVTTKLQVVGQVSQETATQMLLAVDAAYKFDDKAKGLGAVLDGVIAIGDNYATSVEKIAEGIGIIAPIAEQAHVGIDELSAAIGTITADTQRSGTEAARALRYVFLNILQNTSTEVEEGVTLTKEEIEGFQDVLEYFIPDVLALAEAEGKVINPMEALGAIAKGIKEDVIDEAQLFEMLTKVAGKLRASQVLALVNDWDKYEDMVRLFGDSLGETDSKVEVALSSWESKANMLSASFTKLFGSVLNSSMVKGGLDLLKSFVDFLNIGDGVPAKILAIGAAFSTLASVIASFRTGGKIATTLTSLFSFFSNPYFLAGAGIAATVVAIKSAVDANTVTQEELEEKAKTTAQNYAEQKASLEQITAELSKHKQIVAELEGKAGSLTSEEESRLAKEREITAELERQLAYQAYLTEKSAREAANATAAAFEGAHGGKSGVDYLSRSTQTPDGMEQSYLYDWKYLGRDITKATQANYGLGQKPSSSLNANVGYFMALQTIIGTIDEELKSSTDMPRIGKLKEERQKMIDESRLVQDYLAGQYKSIKEQIGVMEAYEEILKKVPEDQWTSDDAGAMKALKAMRFIAGFIEESGAVIGKTEPGTGGSSSTAGEAGSSAVAKTSWQMEQDAQLKRTQALVRANKEYNETLQAGQKFARVTKETYKELEQTGIDFSKKLPGTDLDLSEAVIQDGESFIFLGEALQALNKQSKEWYEKYGIKMPDNFKEIADSAETTAGSFEDLLKKAGSMADEAAAASKALEELKKQLKADGEHGDVLSAYRTEYKTVMEMWQKGLYGSKELQGFMNLVLGDETMAKLGYNYKEAGKLLGKQFYKAMFSPSGKDDFGAEAIRYLYNNVANKAGNIVGENGEVVANLKKVNGEIKITVNSFEGLSKVLGINTDVLLTLFDALGMYKNGLNTTGDDITKLLDSMGEGVSKLNNHVREVDLTKFINTLAANGSSIGEIFQLIQSMGGLKGISFGDADIKDTSALYDQIKEAVSKANDKNFFLAPDASGFTSYSEAAKTAMAEVDTAWAASQAAISGSPATPKMDTSNVQAGTGVLNGTVGVFENYKSEGDGAEATPKMDTSNVQAGTGALNGATGVFNNYQTTGDAANPKPGLDTSKVTAGESAVDAAIEKLVAFGIIDKNAAAGIKTKLVGPEAEMAFATAALLLFGMIDEDATAAIDARDIDGPRQTVEDAEQYLKDTFGITNVSAIAGLKNEIKPEDLATIGTTLIELWAYARTYKATTALEGDATDEQKTAALKAAADELAKIKGRFEAQCEIQGLKVTDSAVAAALAASLNSLKELYETKILVDTSQIEGAQELVDQLEARANAALETMQTALEMQLTPEIANAIEASGDTLGGGKDKSGEYGTTYNNPVLPGRKGGSSASDRGNALRSESTSLKEAAQAWELYGSAVELARATVTEGFQEQDEYFSDDEDLERLRKVADNIHYLQEQASTGGGWSTDAAQALSIYSEYLDLFSGEAVSKMMEGGWKEWFEARDALNEAIASMTTAPEAEESAGAVDELSTALGELPAESTTVVETPGATEAAGEVGALADQLEGLPTRKTVTVGVTWSPGMAPTAPAGFNDPMGAVAEGTRNYPGGRSLVNELGPELIAYGGRAFVAGGGKPTIVDLPRGAMIFDAAETRSIVANSGGLPSGVIGSHAAGLSMTLQTPEQKGLAIIGALGKTEFGGLFGLTGDALAEWAGSITDGRDKTKPKGKGGGGAPVDNTDYWAIVEAHYKEITAVADNAATNLEYQIKLLKDAWDDEKKPLDEQIKALQDLNGIIDRQITLLTRERDKLTKPIQDEVDALKEAKDIQDDQLELEERQKAVEEARAELQNAQNERTIRFYNKETGHWEWMADQKRVQDAQKALEDAQKSLADFEYDQRIKALEAEIKAIEDEYQDKFDKLNEDKQANEDEIYDLNQQLKDLERKYNELIGPLEEEKEDRSRAKEAAENAWTNAQFERREAPKGNLDLAISKTGVPGSIAGGGIKELQADLKTIANAYKGSQQNNTLASLGIQFGATPSYAGTSSVTTVGNNVTDSHDIVINGITLPASAAYQSLMDLANDLSIYVNYK